MAIQNNDTVVTQLTKRINGIVKYMKGEKTEIYVNGELVKPARLQALFQTSLDTRQAVTAGRATYLAAIKDRDDGETLRLAADESLKSYVLTRYGAGSTEANEFGFAQRKKAEVSADTRARAVALNQATRQARGTVGKKKKLQIKGVLPTPTAPAAPASASAAVSAQPVVAAPVVATPAIPVPATVAAPAQGVGH